MNSIFISTTHFSTRSPIFFSSKDISSSPSYCSQGNFNPKPSLRLPWVRGGPSPDVSSRQAGWPPLRVQGTGPSLLRAYGLTMPPRAGRQMPPAKLAAWPKAGARRGGGAGRPSPGDGRVDSKSSVLRDQDKSPVVSFLKIEVKTTVGKTKTIIFSVRNIPPKSPLCRVSVGSCEVSPEAPGYRGQRPCVTVPRGVLLPTARVVTPLLQTAGHARARAQAVPSVPVTQAVPRLFWGGGESDSARPSRKTPRFLQLSAAQTQRPRGGDLSPFRVSWLNPRSSR